MPVQKKKAGNLLKTPRIKTSDEIKMSRCLEMVLYQIREISKARKNRDDSMPLDTIYQPLRSGRI